MALGSLLSSWPGMHPASTALALIAIFGLLYLAYQWALPKPIPGIPYDRNSSRHIAGSIPAILSFERQHGRKWPWFYGEAAKHNSPLTQVWMGPFSRPTVILSDYQESQDIQLRRNREFDRSRWVSEVFKRVLPHHHVTMMSFDPRFKRNKHIVRDLMTPGFLEEISAPQIYSKTMTLIDLWTFKADVASGKPFDASRDIFSAALDIINAAAFAFDDSMNSVKHQLNYLASIKDLQPLPSVDGSVEFPYLPEIPDVKALRAVTQHVDTVSASVAPRLAHRLILLTNSTMRRNIERKNDLISSQIKKSLSRLEAGDSAMRSALDHVVQRERTSAQKAGREPDFHAEHLRDELFGYIVAGHDTSATTLSWMTKLIAQHQGVQSKLRLALQSAYSAALAEKRQPTAKEITKISVPYLDAVIEESLRIHPAVPAIIRNATVDTEILGHKIPKNTDVFMVNEGPGFKSPPIPVDDSLRSETSLKKHWGGTWDEDNMHLFIPERWLKPNENGEVEYDAHAGPILPFGLGPRGCFGKRLAYLELRMVLALLVWNFEFKELSGLLTSNSTHEGITTTARYCYVALQRVQQ